MPVKNWKIIFSIILSSLVLFNTLRVSLTYAYYNLDTKGFIEAFCENKDKPELACNGKCHLKKVLETPNKKGNEPIQISQIKDLILYIENLSSYSFKSEIAFKKQYTSYLNLYSFRVSDIIFHPPKG